jgi:transitional endoplasmic reticulum ATPase
MARRLTREITYVQLTESRIREIKDLVAAWPQETKAFMRARLNQYTPPMGLDQYGPGNISLLFL